MATLRQLTDQERALLEFVSEGLTTNDIAKRMGFTAGTVRVYLHNVYKRIKVKNKAEAMLWFLERNSIKDPKELRKVVAKQAARIVKVCDRTDVSIDDIIDTCRESGQILLEAIGERGGL